MGAVGQPRLGTATVYEFGWRRLGESEMPWWSGYPGAAGLIVEFWKDHSSVIRCGTFFEASPEPLARFAMRLDSEGLGQ